jgi:MFS family permease
VNWNCAKPWPATQQATAYGERGRAFAAFGAVFAAGQAIGMLAAGLLADRVGVVALLDVQAGFYLLTGVTALALLRPEPARLLPVLPRPAVAGRVDQECET